MPAAKEYRVWPAFKPYAPGEGRHGPLERAMPNGEHWRVMTGYEIEAELQVLAADGWSVRDTQKFNGIWADFLLERTLPRPPKENTDARERQTPEHDGPPGEEEPQGQPAPDPGDPAGPEATEDAPRA